jgi:biopolymer transport protein ExbB/TolQ
MKHSHRRNLIALGISTIFTIIFLSVLTVFIGGHRSGDMLLGPTSAYGYPLTLQNLMHLFFFIGLGQLFVRWKTTSEENVFLQMSGFLPEEQEAALSSDADIDAIRVNVNNAVVRGEAMLPDLINTCTIQYLKSHSVSDTIAVLNSTLDLHIHRLDLRYSLSRYIVWAIPTFGFIGTVLGISQGLGKIDLDKFTGAHTDKVLQFRALTVDLNYAFDTTIVALALSAILVFILHIVQKGEEESLNRAGKYVLTNFINRLSNREK